MPPRAAPAEARRAGPIIGHTSIVGRPARHVDPSTRGSGQHPARCSRPGHYPVRGRRAMTDVHAPDAIEDAGRTRGGRRGVTGSIYPSAARLSLAGPEILSCDWHRSSNPCQHTSRFPRNVPRVNDCPEGTARHGTAPPGPLAEPSPGRGRGAEPGARTGRSRAPGVSPDRSTRRSVARGWGAAGA